MVVEEVIKRQFYYAKITYRSCCGRAGWQSVACVCVCAWVEVGVLSLAVRRSKCATQESSFHPPTSNQICVLTSYIIFIPFNRFSGMHFHISVRYFVFLTTAIEQREYCLLGGGGGNKFYKNQERPQNSRSPVDRVKEVQ
jgi:hypothetical protein